MAGGRGSLWRTLSGRTPWLAAVHLAVVLCSKASEGRSAPWTGFHTAMVERRDDYWTTTTYRRFLSRIRGGGSGGSNECGDDESGDHSSSSSSSSSSGGGGGSGSRNSGGSSSNERVGLPTNPRMRPDDHSPKSLQDGGFQSNHAAHGETSSNEHSESQNHGGLPSSSERLGSGDRGGSGSGVSVVPPLSTRAVPLPPEELPVGPVNPYSTRVPVLQLSSDGAAVETTLSRQQLATDLNCPLRDLRLADPTFPGQFPSVLARTRSIIFSVAEVKAVIKAKELLLFPTSPDVLSIVPAVQEKLLSGTRLLPVPFEQIAIECCLKHVCKDLLESVRNVEPRLRKVLGSFETSKTSLMSSLHRLLPLKNELDELQETLVTVRKCMNEVLMKDEDMALMYLTENEESSTARDPTQHQEIEMLFENYLLQVELLVSDVKEFQNEVRNTEEIVQIELDVLRNNILRFELLLSISAFTVTLGALVTGVFGMNLLSGWEETPRTFWHVTGGIYGCIVLCIAGTVAWCRRLSLL